MVYPSCASLETRRFPADLPTRILQASILSRSAHSQGCNLLAPPAIRPRVSWMASTLNIHALHASNMYIYIYLYILYFIYYICIYIYIIYGSHVHSRYSHHSRCAGPPGQTLSWMCIPRIGSVVDPYRNIFYISKILPHIIQYIYL